MLEDERSAEQAVQHHVAHFYAEDALYAYLARLNEDGHLPELGAIDTHGTAFLATLTDPDADRVNYVSTDEGGRAHGVTDWCDDYCRCSWTATYPVVALSQQNPATVWREIAKAEREEAKVHAARIAKARADMGLPPGSAGPS